MPFNFHLGPLVSIWVHLSHFPFESFSIWVNRRTGVRVLQPVSNTRGTINVCLISSSSCKNKEQTKTCQITQKVFSMKLIKDTGHCYICPYYYQGVLIQPLTRATFVNLIKFSKDTCKLEFKNLQIKVKYCQDIYHKHYGY